MPVATGLGIPVPDTLCLESPMLKTLLEGCCLSTMKILEFSPLSIEDGTVLMVSAASKPLFFIICLPLS